MIYYKYENGFHIFSTVTSFGAAGELTCTYNSQFYTKEEAELEFKEEVKNPTI